MKHIYLLTIKNRFSHFQELIQSIETLYTKGEGTKIELFLSVTDFNSEDESIEDFLNKGSLPFVYKNLNENFNLGKGLNTSAKLLPYDDNDILIFCMNDAILPPNTIDIVNENTNKGESVFIPEHECLSIEGVPHLRGGAILWSVFKSDFDIIGDTPESEGWGDCYQIGGNYVGEDDAFIHMANKNGYIINRPRNKRFQAKFHARDFNESWYNSSKCVQQRNLIDSPPPHWKVKNLKKES